jgi:hypothetical protein
VGNCVGACFLGLVGVTAYAVSHLPETPAPASTSGVVQQAPKLEIPDWIKDFSDTRDITRHEEETALQVHEAYILSKDGIETRAFACAKDPGVNFAQCEQDQLTLDEKELATERAAFNKKWYTDPQTWSAKQEAKSLGASQKPNPKAADAARYQGQMK